MPSKILSLIILGILFVSAGVSAGSFTPIPTTPDSSFYTLSDIYNKITSSNFEYTAHPFSPASSPTNTFVSLSQIWSAIPSSRTLTVNDLYSGIIPAGIYATTSLAMEQITLFSPYIATGTSVFGVAGTCAPALPPPPAGPTEGQIISSLRSGLIGYWPGDNNTNDNSGNSNNASWTIGSPSYSPGMFGQAFSFNGNGEVSLNMNNMPTERIYSVSVWAKASRLTMRNGQMIGWGHDWSSDTFALMIGGADNYGDVLSNQFVILNGWKATGYFLNDLNWHHFVATADGSSLKVYVDGELVPNSLSVSNTMSSFIHLGHFPGGYYRAGESGAPFLRYYYGLVDESAIWNRTLSEGEMLDLYNDGAGRSLVQ